jgi:hypothetical protein
MRRLLMLLPAVCLVLATAGCGDDGGDTDEELADEPTSGTPTSEAPMKVHTPAKVAECTAEASTTGAFEAEWHGDAKVRTGGKPTDDPGPSAVYTLTHQSNRLAVYSPGTEFKGSVTLLAEGVAYSSDPADAASLDIDEHGKGASVDVTLTSTGGDTIDVVAEFTCDKEMKK